MMEYAAISGIISGMCFVVLSLRKKLPVLGSILESPIRAKNLRFMDKLLALIMLISLSIGLFIIIIAHWGL